MKKEAKQYFPNEPLDVKKEKQIFNGATVPDTSKPKEFEGTDADDQFPGQKLEAKMKTEQRLLQFKEFISTDFDKFNSKTIEKEKMSKEKEGKKGYATLENENTNMENQEKKVEETVKVSPPAGEPTVKEEQFPDQKGGTKSPTGMPSNKKIANRLLSFKEFISDNCCKFGKDSIDKHAMSGPVKGEKGHDTLEEPDKPVDTSK